MQSAALKGLIGEIQFGEYLNSLDLKSPEIFVNNLPLKKLSGYVQIDYVVVSKRGVYCIEVKNWNCRVKCDYYADFWEITYPTSVVFSTSPWKQNAYHCERLSSDLGINVKNVVVFADCCTLKDTWSGVLHFSDFSAYLTRQPEIFSDSEVAEISEQVLALKKKNDAGLFVDFFFKYLGGK